VGVEIIFFSVEIIVEIIFFPSLRRRDIARGYRDYDPEEMGFSLDFSEGGNKSKLPRGDASFD